MSTDHAAEMVGPNDLVLFRVFFIVLLASAEYPCRRYVRARIEGCSAREWECAAHVIHLDCCIATQSGRRRGPAAVARMAMDNLVYVAGTIWHSAVNTLTRRQGSKASPNFGVSKVIGMEPAFQRISMSSRTVSLRQKRDGTGGSVSLSLPGGPWRLRHGRDIHASVCRGCHLEGHERSNNPSPFCLHKHSLLLSLLDVKPFR